MSYCSKCGRELGAADAFCPGCGSKNAEINTTGKRIDTYDGKIHKCPQCGEVLESFSIKCPSCGFELRDNEGSKVVRAFADELTTKSDADKFVFIKNFPIPNSKEGILEFMILAVTNFDVKEYIKKHSDTPSKAWFVKIEQCYIKAKMMFPEGDQTLSSIKRMYDQIFESIKEEKKISSGKKFIFSPLFWAAFFFELFAAFMTIGSFISGAILSGIFGLVMNTGLITTILMGRNVICVKYRIIKYFVFVAALLFFIPLVACLPSGS